jgi:hypothetical protein
LQWLQLPIQRAGSPAEWQRRTTASPDVLSGYS